MLQIIFFTSTFISLIIIGWVVYRLYVVDYLALVFSYLSLLLTIFVLGYTVGASLEVLTLIFCLLIFTPLFYFAFKNKGKYYIKSLTDDYLPNGIELIIILFPLFLAFLSLRFVLSYHGTYHLLITNEIFQGAQPLFNPILPDTPINTYWGYHLLLTLFSKMFAIAPPLISYGLNITSLYFSFIVLRKTLDDKLNALIILFSTNILYPLFSKLPDVYEKADVRLINLYDKFLNFSGFPFALLLFILLITSDKKYRPFLILGLLIVHPTTALIGIAYIALIELRENIDPLRGLFLRIIYYLIPCALAVPYFLSLTTNLGEPAFELDFSGTWINDNFGVLVATLLPIIIWWGFRENKKKVYYNELVSLLLVIVTLFIDVAGNNQYKFVFLTNILLYFTVIKNSTRTAFTRVIAGLLTGLILINFLFTAQRYLSKQEWLNSNISFNSQTIVLADQTELVNQLKKHPMEYFVVRGAIPHKNDVYLEAASQRYPYIALDSVYLDKNSSTAKERIEISNNSHQLICHDANTIFIEDGSRNLTYYCP